MYTASVRSVFPPLLFCLVSSDSTHLIRPPLLTQPADSRWDSRWLSLEPVYLYLSITRAHPYSPVFSSWKPAHQCLFCSCCVGIFLKIGAGWGNTDRTNYCRVLQYCSTCRGCSRSGLQAAHEQLQSKSFYRYIHFKCIDWDMRRCVIIFWQCPNIRDMLPVLSFLG